MNAALPPEIGELAWNCWRRLGWEGFALTLPPCRRKGAPVRASDQCCDGLRRQGRHNSGSIAARSRLLESNAGLAKPRDQNESWRNSSLGVDRSHTWLNSESSWAWRPGA